MFWIFQSSKTQDLQAAHTYFTMHVLDCLVPEPVVSVPYNKALMKCVCVTSQAVAIIVEDYHYIILLRCRPILKLCTSRIRRTSSSCMRWTFICSSEKLLNNTIDNWTNMSRTCKFYLILINLACTQQRVIFTCVRGKSNCGSYFYF